MKKISLLIALCMLLTVGGVYATWIYTANDVADQNQPMSLTLTNTDFEGTHGTYTIDVSHLTMTIDPKENHTDKHTTALYFNDDGYVRITFTPNENAPADVKQYGLLSYFSLSLSNNSWTFDDNTGAGARNIITLNHNEEHRILPTNVMEDGVMNWVKEGNSFHCDIPVEFFEDHIILTEFLLDTKADYDNFQTVLENGKIIAHISDGVTSQN